MKVIIKILEYLSERDAVVIRSCWLNSHKPIDNYPEIVILFQHDHAKLVLFDPLTAIGRINLPCLLAQRVELN